ncbi:MAG: Uncharacterised protein [Methanobacteriota archaeon]|nr:hypothetical protein [Euryarchaeota archaeon]CAI8211380.1 MAG: Uncharacterised protein [Euryarchaeota archaeon]
MDTPARTIERLFTLATVGSAFGAGFLLIEASACNDNLDVAITCAESTSVDVGRALLALAALLGILVTQAWFARSSNRSSWISMVLDDRTEEEVRLDAETINDDVEGMGEGWAKLEEQMLTSRIEEE